MRHKHRRHHRHRHRSKKLDEEDEETKASVEEVVEAPLPPPPFMLLPSESSRPAEDVEEGEILDDEGGGSEVKADSGAESCEIKSPGDRDNRIPGGDDLSRSPIVEPRREDHSDGLPSRGDGDRKKYYIEDADDRGKLAIKEESPFRSNGDKYYEGLRCRSRSRSRDHGRERSHPRSIVKEEASFRRRSHSRSMVEEESISERRLYNEQEMTEYVEKRKAAHDSDEEGMVRDDDREPSTGYRRYSGLDHSRYRENSRETEVDRVRRREKELERNNDWVRRRDKERERSIERDSLRDRKRGSRWGDIIDRVGDRESRREERHRSRDRTREDDVDRIRGRVKDEGDREMERDRNRGRDKDRKWERHDDRYRDNDRVLERERNGSEGGYGARGKYDHSGQSRYEDKEYKHDGSAKSDQAEVQLER